MRRWGLALGLACCFPGWAADESALAGSKGCRACHTAERKLTGPSYQEIAERYRGNAKAPAMLAGKIKAGSRGLWGSGFMPPNNVSEDEARRLAQWILATPQRKQ